MRTVLDLLARLSGVGLGPEDRSFWLPPDASTTAHNVDWLFQFILAISVFFFLLIVTLMIVFVIRFRRRAGHAAADSPSHNTALEVTWTVIPVILVAVIFYLGFKGFMDMSVSPGNAYEVQVEGQKWNWTFTYPNGYVDSNLHVPVDRPVRLVMSSADVIHSLYIPAFRVKQDVVPGRYSKVWFEATEVGEFDIFCAEYCGTSHSDMLAKVVVHEPGGFETWLAEASDFLSTMPPVDAGRKLVQVRGCFQCHTTDGTARIGPSFKDVVGRDRVLTTGETVVVDENYIRESILEPMAKVAAGYDPVMPTYQGRLQDDEVLAVIEYLKSLSGAGEEE